MKLNQKHYLKKSIEIKSTNDATGEFTGYISVFDVVDHARDVVLKGAFANSIKKLDDNDRFLPCLWQHDSHQPIGKFTKLEEDDYGLYVEAQLLINDVAKAKEAFALVKNGVIGGLSIGYRVGADGYEYDQEEDIFYLKNIDLIEASVVTFPCNELATVSDVKSKLEDGELPSLKEFEKFLREAGFSRTQATAIANGGLSKLHKEQSESVSVKEISTQLNELKELLKGN